MAAATAIPKLRFTATFPAAPQPDLPSPADAAFKTLDASATPEIVEVPLEVPGVFRGYELTRKDRRLRSGLAPIDNLLGGGILYGRISEISGPPSCGKTSLAASFVATATRRGEVAAWLDTAGAFDPESMAAVGVDLSRVLFLKANEGASKASRIPSSGDEAPVGLRKASRASTVSKKAEIVLQAGGFGLVVIDFGTWRYPLAQSPALRLARAAERSGTAVIIIAARRICGSFGAVSLALDSARAHFNRSAGAPPLFDGFGVVARVAHNKFGGAGNQTAFTAAVSL